MPMGGTHDCDSYDTNRANDRLACFIIIGTVGQFIVMC